MKNIFKNKKNTRLIGLFLTVGFVLFLIGCVFIDSVSILQIQEDGTQAPRTKAGSVATFILTGHINCQEDHGDVQFIFSFLAPKSWNVRQNATVTYTTTLATNPEEELKMSVVPESSLPKNGGGRTWGEALMQEYGVGPNVLSDMEWVTFATNDKWAIYNGDKPNYTIYLRTNVGYQNLKAYLGFFVNHTDDGMSTSADHKKVKFSDTPFEVYGGKGLMIDYSTDHFNKVQPLASLQDDYVTFSFNGGVYQNDLISCSEIYFEGIAYDENGEIISEVNEKTDKTLLHRESMFSQVYSLTMWPASFFNVPQGKEIKKIDYVFTNKDRSIIITQSDDDFAINHIPINSEKEPFVFELLCD
ncbi:MAG TPA: DUF4961 domain-containing protein [Paludibacteraceae bacterium]|nr:DUF4961 domain-containing protein [Paludibacteraceae bacterium]HOK99932.1 DUF4961 domain-containing protein [Paludibacteraceae bacterium]HPO66733.1 DUF4961 domain-containing protein [Paludibacteraceae bacterium]HRU63455.1 DUF4961 domain-containing protein [Paludibacteraceae bacterium]